MTVESAEIQPVGFRAYHRCFCACSVGELRKILFYHGNHRQFAGFAAVAGVERHGGADKPVERASVAVEVEYQRKLFARAYGFGCGVGSYVWRQIAHARTHFMGRAVVAVNKYRLGFSLCHFSGHYGAGAQFKCAEIDRKALSDSRGRTYNNAFYFKGRGCRFCIGTYPYFF